MGVTEQGLLERDKDTMTLNMGPQHPSTHGVFRVILEMDGEIVRSAEPDIGFLHTGIEKTAENKRYVHCIPMTDRLDYLSPPQNNLAFCLTVERLLGLKELPARADYLRVIMCELGRIGSHLVWLRSIGRTRVPNRSAGRDGPHRRFPRSQRARTVAPCPSRSRGASDRRGARSSP